MGKYGGMGGGRTAVAYFAEFVFRLFFGREPKAQTSALLAAQVKDPLAVENQNKGGFPGHLGETKLNALQGI